MTVRKWISWWSGAALAGASFASAAATFVVNSTVDGVDAAPGNNSCATAAGACTLRAAIQESNALAGADIITLPSGTYVLTIPGAGEDAAATGDLDIIDDLTINGGNPTSAADTIIDGGGAAGTLRDRVIETMNGPTNRPVTIRINGVTIRGGYDASSPNGGGGICHHCTNTNINAANEVPTLHLMTVILRDNYSGTAGAGVANHAVLMIDDSIIERNSTPYGSPDSGPTGFGGGMGGGLMNWGGTVSISRTTFANNYAQTGGGIYNQDAFLSGVVLLTDCTVKDNVAAFGGGVYNLAIGDFNFPARVGGQVGFTVNRGTISGNFAEIDGGGVYNLAIGTIAMINATVAMNQAGGRGGLANYPNRGGGIYNGGRLLDLINVTLAGNESAAVRVTGGTADGSRGGDELFLNTQNAGGAPINSIPMVVNLQNVIVGDGAGTDDNCNGATGFSALVTGGNNIDSGSTCGFTGATNQSNIDPMVGALADNGGPMLTMALFNGSPALNRGTACPAVDERGMSRDAQCDLGAVEQSAVGAPPPVGTPPPPAANTAPVARNGALAVNINTAINGTLVAVDNERDPLTYRIASNGTLGTAALISTSSGAFTYTAGAIAGTDTFTFVANDGRLDSNVATVTVTVGTPTAPPPVNTPPVAAPGTLTVAPGATAQGVLSASDANGNALTYRINTPPARGTVTVTNAAAGVYSYTANAGVTGTDSFTFVANDGLADSNSATIAVTYAAANAPPSANPGVLTVAAGASATGTLSATDSNGDALTFAMVADARKGVLSINATTGAYAYTAASNATGTDSFTFKASDGKADSAVAAVTITITNANAPPAANPGVLSVASGASVVGQLVANDPDGDLVSFAVTQAPTQGVVTITNQALGTFQYTANRGAVGTDAFAFTVNDGRSVSAPAVVNVTLGTNGAAVKSLPQASDLALQVDGTGNVTAMLPVSNESGASVVFEIVKQAAQGEVTLNPSTGVFTYRAANGASGVDSFNYRVTTGGAASNTAVVKLSIARAVSAPPATTPTTTTGAATKARGGGALSLWWLVVAAGGMVLRRRF